MSKKDSLLALLPFWLFVFLFKFAAGLHYTLLPALGERVLPLWVVGLVIGASSFLQLIFDVPAGFLLDRFGYVRVMRVSTFIFFLGALVLVFHFGVATFIISVFLGCVGWLFYGPGINAYVLAKAPSREGGTYMGTQHMFASLGIVCATFLFVAIIHNTVATIGITIAAIFVLALIALWGAEKDRASLSEIQTKHEHHAYYVRRHFVHKVLGALKRLDPPSTILALQNVSGAIFYAMIWFVIPLVIVAQASTGILGIGLSIFDLAVVALGAFLGKLADRYHKKVLIFIGLLLFSAAGVFLGFQLNLFFLFFGFLATTGDEMSSASLWSWLERLDTNHRDDGLINGAIVLFEDIGWTIGPVIAGFLYESVGPSTTIALGAIPILILWIFSAFFLKNKVEPELLFAPGYSRKPIRHRHKK